MNKIKFNSIDEFYNFLEEDTKTIYIDFYKLFTPLIRLKEIKKKEKSNEVKKIQYEIHCASFRIKDAKLNPISDYLDKKSFSIEECKYFEKRLNFSLSYFVKSQYSTILWYSQKKHHKYAKVAVDSFLEKVKISEELDQENISEHYGLGTLIAIKNAFYIAYQSKYKTQEVKKEIKRLLNSYSFESNISYALRVNLIELMLEKRRIFYRNSFEGLDDLCWRMYKRIKNEGSIQQAIDVLYLGERVASKLQKHKHIWEEHIAKCYEELMLKEGKGSFMALVHCQKAIKIYKEMPNEKKIEELERKYIVIKEQTELKIASIKIDPSEYIKINSESKEIAEKLVKNNSGDEILKIITNNNSILPRYTELKKSAERVANGSVFSQFFSTFSADKMGNIFQKLSKEDEKEFSEVLNLYKYTLELYKLPLINHIFITAILNSKFTTEIILNYFKNNSWFGKKYKKIIFKKEIEYDWIKLIAPVFREYFEQISIYFAFPNHQPELILCIDSLTIKFEGLMRDLCSFSKCGIPTFSTTKMKNGEISTEEINLNKILNDQRLKNIFSDDEILFFRFLFTEKAGYNLRNEVAHSILEYNEYSLSIIHLLFLALLIIGKYNLKKA